MSLTIQNCSIRTKVTKPDLRAFLTSSMLHTSRTLALLSWCNTTFCKCAGLTPDAASLIAHHALVDLEHPVVSDSERVGKAARPAASRCHWENKRGFVASLLSVSQSASANSVHSV